MLQNLGDKLKSQRWLATIVLVPLALIFAIWGAYGVVNMSFGAPDYALKVNGERVSSQTINRAWQERQAQYQQMLNGSEMSDEMKKTIQQKLLDEFIRNTLVRQRAEHDGFRATPQQIADYMHSEPAFQVDGKYDPRAASIAIAQIGMTDRSFIAERSQSMAVGQLNAGIENSEFMTPTELERVYALENEQRELRYVLLPADHFTAGLKIDDARIKSWYDAHASDYMTPESVKLKYIELRLDTLASQVTVKPEDLQAYYEKVKSRYDEPEKRHAHHILITIADAKDAKAEAAALARANQIEADLKSGKDFADLAKKFSGDPGSAAQGGDLGWADKSAFVGPFADALFSMQPGQISEPIKTQFGYHVIRLDEIRPAHVRAFEEVKTELETEYRRDQAAELFGDRQEQLQQRMEGGSSDLDALAKQFDLSGGEIQDFTRTTGGAPLGGTPALLAAVFNDDVLAGNKLGGPVAIAEDHLVVFRVLEHHAPAPQPLASVRDEIIAAIKKSESTVAAKSAADNAVKQLDSGTPFDQVVKALGVTSAPAAYVGRNDPQVPLQVRQEAFRVPHPNGKPADRAVALDDGGAAVLAVTAVKPGTAGTNPQNDSQLVVQFLRRDRDGAMNAYLAELQRRADVKRAANIFE
jgi:peptidyl-prolyl cis-trans isomerase D